MKANSTSRLSLTPEKYFARISYIDIKKDLIAPGFSHILIDIDNTVRSRATHDIPRDVGVWMGQVREAGIGMCLLSNNWHSDIFQFAGALDVPIVAKACKPLPFAFMRASRKIGGSADDTVVVGDQIMTDVLGAHIAKMAAYLVQPLAPVDLKHTLILRNLESSILRGYEPERVPEMGSSMSANDIADEL